MNEEKEKKRRAKRPVYDYIEQEKVINKPWLCTKDLLIIIPTGQKAVNKFRQSICKEMDDNGEFYYKKYEANEVQIIKNAVEEVIDEEEKANLKELQELEKLERLEKNKIVQDEEI